MNILAAVLVTAALGAAFYFLALPRLRRQSWWSTVTAHLWALLGNSKTILAAVLVEALAALDELKVIDWSSLFGAERGGRIASVLGIVMIVLRLVTTRAVSFRVQEPQ